MKKLLASSQPNIQASLGKVAEALNQSERMNNSETQKTVASLIDTTTNEQQIIKQVAIFAAGPDEQQPLIALAVLHALDPPPGEVIEALSPYLDADNVKVRSFVRDWFQSHDNGGPDESPLKPVNFADYTDFVRRKLQEKENIPEAFVDYLFERSPGRALLVFNLADRHGEIVDRLKAMRREVEQEGNLGPNDLPPSKEGLGRREVVLAEHVISNALWLHKHNFDDHFQTALPEAMTELEKLSKHMQWWARLYVVYIMRQNPVLLKDNVLRQLAEDENPSVSKAAQRQPPAPKTGKKLVAPREINARATGPTSIEITWQASDGATSYAVQRRRAGIDAEFTTIASNVVATTYTDNKLDRDARFEYRVIAHQKP